MSQVVLEVFSDSVVTGTRRRLAFAPALPGRQFSWIPPEKRRVSTAHHCAVGHEATRDYYYSHQTGRAGDLKLCRVHEMIEDESALNRRPNP